MMTVLAGSPLSVLTSYQCITSHSIEKADSATWGTLIVLPSVSSLSLNEAQGNLLRRPLGQTGEFPLVHIVWGINGCIIGSFQEWFRDDRHAKLLGVLDVRIGIYHQDLSCTSRKCGQTLQAIWVLVGTLDRDHDCRWVMRHHVEV
jgi:hypothetical protein